MYRKILIKLGETRKGNYMQNTLTLRKGTWFRFSSNDESKLGEIIDYQQDEERPELHWFKCHLKFDLRENLSIDVEKVYSSRNFEQFPSLQLLSEEDGLEFLETLEDSRNIPDMIIGGDASEEAGSDGILAAAIRRAARTPGMFGGLTREEPVSIRERIDRAVHDRDHGGTERGVETRPARTRPAREEPEATEPERAYQSATTFRVSRPETNVSSKNFQTPLGSGDMKSVLKLYTVNPERSWESVNNIIDETGHLLLTYADGNTRRKIIQQKIDYMLNHKWMTLTVNTVYKLERDSKETIALYLGKNRWAMHPTRKNDIVGLYGNNFIKIPTEEMIHFGIDLFPITDEQEILKDIIDQTQEINPTELHTLANEEEANFYCATTAPRDELLRNDLTRNWEKAFVYNYYVGEELNTQLELSKFKDVEAITKLAAVKDDTQVLERLVA